MFEASEYYEPNGLCEIYNEGTDMTVQANRAQAVKHICDAMSYKSFTTTFSVRYNGGYYLMYVVNRIRTLSAADIRYDVMEYTTPTGQRMIPSLKCANWSYTPGETPTILWSM